MHSSTSSYGLSTNHSLPLLYSEISAHKPLNQPRRQIQNTADEEGYQENVPNVPTEEELNYDIEELNLDTGIEECGAPADLAMNELSNQRLKADHNGRTSPTPLTNSHILQGRAQKMLER